MNADKETARERFEDVVIEFIAVPVAAILWLVGMCLVIKDKVRRYIDKKLLK